jgi:hypothetical protein
MREEHTLSKEDLMSDRVGQGNQVRNTHILENMEQRTS